MLRRTIDFRFVPLFIMKKLHGGSDWEFKEPAVTFHKLLYRLSHIFVKPNSKYIPNRLAALRPSAPPPR